ncbi:sodium:calcium antiporter [Cryptosporangium arvum]|uniref:Ca2+/Na+ antiporter n=1 Tax=Cryptosporangium arvum DSM 44712 TaxID=927661 RepID=A0A011ALU1_9ACTN|nr:sodium:proton exchanger [Cryptosporangium arvum]EXG82911.1 Ca2+/Na+ antiporter [Cryptosporangium arvum DSM 44712]
MSILIFVVGAALLVYCAEKLVVYLVGAAHGLRISVFLLAIIFTGIEFDDLALGVALNAEDLGGVALGTVFGTAISMTGIVLALAAIVCPTRVHIPRSYLALFAASPLMMVPFVLSAPLTAADGVVLVLLFVAFIAYIATRELQSSTPIFRNAEILERIGADGPGAGEHGAGGSGAGGVGAGGVGVAGVGGGRPGDRPPFVVTMPFTKDRPLPRWGGIGLAVLALLGLIVAATITSAGIDGILDDYAIGGTLFGATIATLVLSLEDIFLTVEPNRRGAAEIGIGNVIGSVVFGVTAKLGIILLTGGAILVGDDVLAWHLPVLVVMTGLSAYFISTGRLRRWHGFVLLALYLLYWAVSWSMFGEVPIDAD